jgi:hypothetical protein
MRERSSARWRFSAPCSSRTRRERFAFRELALILGSIVAFGLVLRGAGLAPAVLLLVLGGGFASKQFHLGRFLAVGVGLSVFATLVYIKGLGPSLSIFGPWLGG